jgi:hypothetical protein
MMFHQVKNRQAWFFIAPIVVLAILVFPAIGRQQIAMDNTDQAATGIPFEKKSESYAVSVGRPWWTVRIILPKEYYSRENLEKIFNYYMGKYPDKRTALSVDVFADAQTFERYNTSRGEGLAVVFPGQPSPPKTKDNWNSSHAYFLRGCDNQFYYYSPDLESPVERERVLLKGRFTIGPELAECSEQNKQ